MVPLPGWLSAVISPPQVQTIRFTIFSTLPPKNRKISDKFFFTISSLGKISEMKKTGFTQERPFIQHRYIGIDSGNIMTRLRELIRKRTKNY
jgi:hypothetical protein